ncbi:MAG: RHS repeat-associated core domain-containing protein [Bacilli bacterium]|nr:RHS repeat-associated core domain-containing protein [Bacilli bacterium]
MSNNGLKNKNEIINKIVDNTEVLCNVSRHHGNASLKINLVSTLGAYKVDFFLYVDSYNTNNIGFGLGATCNLYRKFIFSNNKYKITTFEGLEYEFDSIGNDNYYNAELNQRIVKYSEDDDVFSLFDGFGNEYYYGGFSHYPLEVTFGQSGYKLDLTITDNRLAVVKVKSGSRAISSIYITYTSIGSAYYATSITCTKPNNVYTLTYNNSGRISNIVANISGYGSTPFSNMNYSFNQYDITVVDNIRHRRCKVTRGFNQQEQTYIVTKIEEDYYENNTSIDKITTNVTHSNNYYTKVYDNNGNFVELYYDNEQIEYIVDSNCNLQKCLYDDYKKQIGNYSSISFLKKYVEENNLVKNGYFENSSHMNYWSIVGTSSGGISYDNDRPLSSAIGPYYLYINNMGNECYLKQTINIKGSELDNYTLVLWVKQLSLGTNSNYDLSIEVKYNTSDNIVSPIPFTFVENIPHSSTINPNWHPLIFDVSKHKNFDSIDLMIKLPNTGIQYAIDGIILIKNKVINESSYYLFGKKSKQENKDEMVNYVHNYHDSHYNIDKLGMIIDKDGIITRYSYDDACVNVVSEEKCNKTIQRVYDENEKNNLLSETITCGNKKVVSSNEYTESKDYIEKEISYDDSETEYTTGESSGRVSKIVPPTGINEFYAYNSVGLKGLTLIRGSSFDADLNYLYNDQMKLTKVEKLNYELYRYNYQNLKLNSVTLQNNNLLLESYNYQSTFPYGISKIKKGSNGDEVQFIYDSYGNIKQVQYKLKGDNSFSLKYEFEYDDVAHASLKCITNYIDNDCCCKDFAYDAIGNIETIYDSQNHNYDVHYLFDDYKNCIKDIDIENVKRIEVIPYQNKEQKATKKDLIDSCLYQLNNEKRKYYCFFDGTSTHSNYLKQIFCANRSNDIEKTISPSIGDGVVPVNNNGNWYFPISTTSQLKYIIPSEYINADAHSLINGSIGFLFIPTSVNSVKTLFSIYDNTGYSRLVCENIDDNLIVKIYRTNNACYETYNLETSCKANMLNYFGFSFSFNLSTNEKQLWFLINNRKYHFSFDLNNTLCFTAFSIGSYKNVSTSFSTFKLYSLMFMPLNYNVNVLNITGLSKNYHLLKDIYETANEKEEIISMDTFPTNTINSITDFIPLTTSFISKSNRKPVYLNLRYDEDCIRNRYFKYNSLLKQNMLKMDGINLVYDLSLGHTFTIAMNVIFNRLMAKNYIYTIKDNSKYISLLSVNNQLYLDVNGSLTNINITITANAAFFISLGLDYVASSDSLICDYYKVRIVVNNSSYENTINITSLSNPLLIVGSKGMNENLDYFMDGYINSLCYNNTYMSVTSVNTLRGEVKPVRSEAIIDGFGRVNKKVLLKDTFKLEKTLAYKQVEESSQVFKDTMIVDSEIIKDNSNNTLLQRSYEYGGGHSYGNISKIKENGSIKNQYVYNEKGYLITSYYNNEGKFDTFEINSDGNITRKLTRHPTSLYVYSDISYVYDSSWPDRLVQVGDKRIEYDNDSIGCPKHYGYFDNNGVFTSGITYSWRLSKLIGLTDSINNKTINYDYDEEGKRIKKTVDDVNHYYYYEGDRLLTEIISNGKRLEFLYDESNDIIGFDYHANGATSRYYFIKNILGDVVKIVDSSGIVRVTYEYSAYGDVLSISGSYASTIGNLNPIRYRSYYYDDDTEMYYLKTRYYNPNWCRFISSDNINYLEYDNPLNISLFRYCANNPVMNVDPDGTWIWIVILASIAIAATAHDMYQIFRSDEDKKVSYSIQNGEVIIKNSREILTPWVKYIYSIYLNHINADTKDMIKGTSMGMEFEWWVHNAAYYIGSGLKLLGVKKLFGLDIDEPLVSAESVNIGKSIYADKHGWKSGIMHLGYLLINPFGAIHDLFLLLW